MQLFGMKIDKSDLIYLVNYNYGFHEKLISIIIKLRKGYFPEVRRSEGK
jgi:hypothetical protein